MMNVVGLVVEYNPLHNGHRYHFEQALAASQAEASVIVMSGNFLQRGEPAIVDKWARTKMALKMGVDLVFELPYVYATQHASWFAFGAVSLLNQLPFVTHLCFGSESGELNPLLEIAHLIAKEPEPFKETLRQKMKSGWSYPRAYSYALLSITKGKEELAELINKPNNILGLYYLLALIRSKSKIIPLTIKRHKAQYHQREFGDAQIASATSIRHALFSHPIPRWKEIEAYVPPYTLSILKEEYHQGRGLISWESYYPYLAHLFLAQSAEQLREIYEMNEGIEHRIKKQIASSATVEQLIKAVKTKRYTHNRIQRIFVHTLTQCRKACVEQLHLDHGPAYLRLLGYSKKGRELLNQYKKSLAIPLISAIKKDHPPMLDWDIKAAQIYALGFHPDRRKEEINREMRQKPIQLGD